MADNSFRGFWNFIAGSNSKPNKPSPKKEVGAPGFAVFGGFIQERDTNANLTGLTRYKTYSEIALNTSIAAAGIRSFFNLIQRTEWTVEAAEDMGKGKSSDEAKRLAEWVEEQLAGTDSSWSKIITRAANYKFNGFSWSEWSAKVNDERSLMPGSLGILDVRLRPVHTIERWEIEPNKADILGVYQRVPNTMAEVYLPRWKALYLVDDLLTDDPRGTGLLRHCVDPALRLKEYLRNEGMGIQRDLRGIPVVKAPINELNELVEAGEMDADTRDTKLNNLKNLATMESKSEDTGIMVDSEVYFSETETGSTPSSAPKYSVELLSGNGSSSTGIADTGAAIDRLNREIARILGVEHLMLGDGSGGNRALSEDKSRNFFLQMEGTLQDIQEATEKDIIDQLWNMNGFDPALKPTLTYEAVQFKDVQKVTASLRDMATAGAVLDPRDPVVDEVRSLLGLSPQSEELLEEMMEEREQMKELREQGFQGGKPGDDPDNELDNQNKGEDDE